LEVLRYRRDGFPLNTYINICTAVRKVRVSEDQIHGWESNQ
jgi:hypothetical protein